MLVPRRLVTPAAAQKLKERALDLTRHHGVSQLDVAGAYDQAPQQQVEFLFHEVAHWLTLGRPLSRLPRRLSTTLTETIQVIPRESADSLEIDTALVTFVAGCLLGLWDDPAPIASSCRRNLQCITCLGPDDVVTAIMKQRWNGLGRAGYLRMATSLANWLQPKKKLQHCMW